MGGKDLTMAEVNRVMEQISRHCEHAQIIMGAAVDETLKDRLSVTVIAAKQNAGAGMRIACRCAGIWRCADTSALATAATCRRGPRRRCVAAVVHAWNNASRCWPGTPAAARRKAGRQNAPGPVAAGDYFQRPVRQERADHSQGRRPRHPDLHPPRRGVELNCEMEEMPNNGPLATVIYPALTPGIETAEMRGIGNPSHQMRNGVAIIGAVLLLSTSCGKASAPYGSTIYDSDPNHLWNRLNETLFVQGQLRTAGNTAWTKWTFFIGGRRPIC